MKRHKMSRRKSKRVFTKYSGHHRKNYNRSPMRGGIRF